MRIQYTFIFILLSLVAAQNPISKAVDVARKIRGKSDQDLSGLSGPQRFCAYHSVSGSAGLHQVQHKIQNAVLGGSIECTLEKALG
ncbi:hypothetical protein F5H01DRAFT_329525 [Linnemannia elongata]|nr:hypothetical protein F5H01DRAFT_329525 [Linnemannia elongata]